ncbi:MAG: hypothetical protein ACP5SH_24225 [Syntrophobacteraceae bacterium]
MKESVVRMYHSVCKFLASHDLPTVLRELHKVNLAVVAKNPYTWLVTVPIVVSLLWKKKFKLIIALVSAFLFLVLAQNTLASSGTRVHLQDVLLFVGGTTALLGVNLYMLFIRE